MSSRRSVPTLAALPAFLAGALTLASPEEAHAAGFERVPPGARDLGRGGASVVGGDSPNAVFYNPATILRGTSRGDLEGSLHLHFLEECYQNVPVDESSGTPVGGTPNPTVCGEGPLTVFPELAGTFRFNEKLAINAGLYVPPAAARSIHFGDPETVTIPNPSGMGTVPTPSRYLLVEQTLLQVFPTVAIAYAPHPRVRLGLSFAAGITTIDYSNVAWSYIRVVGNTITATADALSSVSGHDYFTPRISFGLWTQPVANVPLEVGGSLTWTGPVHTDDATLNVRSLSTQIMPQWVGDLVGGNLEANGTFHGVGMDVPQTSTLAFGLRYAKKLDRPADDIGDRLSTERFDVELDTVVTLSNNVDSFDVTLPPNSSLTVPSPVAIIPDINVALPAQISLQHRWKTQVALRLGGDYNVLPGRLAVRAAFSFESNGQQHGYEQLDFQPFRLFGLHCGGTVRVARFLDLSASYTHVFVSDVTVSPADARIRRIVSGDADPNDPTQATLVNAGKYWGHSDVIVLGATGHF